MLTPLNAIIGYSELCQEEAAELGKPDVVSDLKRINQAGYNLHRLFESKEFAHQNRRRRRHRPSRQSRPTPCSAPTMPASKPPRPMEFLGNTGAQYSGNLLVVDDDAMNREMLARRLQRSGFNVTTAENGRVALDLLKQHGFDLVLLDIIMPELNGFHTLEFIKADPKLRHLPVIMLTALDEVDSTVRCIEAGAEDYVPKPFNTDHPSRAHQRLARKEAAARPGAGLPCRTAGGARQVRPAPAQRPAQGHRRPPEAGRADHCRQLPRGHGGVCRHRRLHQLLRQHCAQPHGAAAQRPLLGLRQTRRDLRARKDQDHRRFLHGGRRRPHPPARACRALRPDGAGHARGAAATSTAAIPSPWTSASGSTAVRSSPASSAPGSSPTISGATPSTSPAGWNPTASRA